MSLFLEEVGSPITENRDPFYSKTAKKRKRTSYTIEPITKIQAESNV
jgi:hypothetical protein